MSVLIGHASIDERGRASGGQAGDQTGREVCIRDWYYGSWNVLLRPKNAAAAEKMAAFCEAVCRGNMVGYDQGQRNTLRVYAKAAGWDGSKIKERCETDCSAFMTVCAEAAGIAIEYTGGWNAPVTQNMRSRFAATGAFEVLTESKYLTGTDFLRRGDILVRESGHTAMVLSNGAKAGVSVTTTASTEQGTVTKVKATQAASRYDVSLKGTYEVTASALNVREGAGTKYRVLTAIPNGTRVFCSGFYNREAGQNWPFVWFSYGGVAYEAYVCGDYLRKV